MPGQQNWWIAWWMQEAVTTSGWTTGGRLPFRSSAVLRLSWWQGTSLRWCPGRGREDLRMLIQTQIWQVNVHTGWYRPCGYFCSLEYSLYLIFKSTILLPLATCMTKDNNHLNKSPDLSLKYLLFLKNVCVFVYILSWEFCLLLFSF